MKFAIAIYVIAFATLAHSQPLTIEAKQSIRPSPPVALSSIQRPQPPVKKPTQQPESIPSIISTQESMEQPQREVLEIIPQRPNVEEMIIIKPQEYLNTISEILRPNVEVVEIINKIPNIKDIEFAIPHQAIEYFNGKVIHEPHYPNRY